MTRIQLQKFLKSVKYKPGFSARLLTVLNAKTMGEVAACMKSGKGNYLIQFLYTAQDAHTTEKKSVEITSINRMSIETVEKWSAIDAKALVVSTILDLEAHEMGEHLYFDDEQFFDPHGGIERTAKVREQLLELSGRQKEKSFLS